MKLGDYVEKPARGGGGGQTGLPARADFSSRRAIRASNQRRPAMADDAGRLRDGNGRLRVAIEQALKLRPESKPVVKAITRRQEPNASLELIQVNLRDRARALIERHPDDPRVKAIFERVKGLLKLGWRQRKFAVSGNGSTANWRAEVLSKPRRTVLSGLVTPVRSLRPRSQRLPRSARERSSRRCIWRRRSTTSCGSWLSPSGSGCTRF
jgi:hypothetical protein